MMTEAVEAWQRVATEYAERNPNSRARLRDVELSHYLMKVGLEAYLEKVKFDSSHTRAITPETYEPAFRKSNKTIKDIARRITNPATGKAVTRQALEQWLETNPQVPELTPIPGRTK
jgi:hypothetical protein